MGGKRSRTLSLGAVIVAAHLKPPPPEGDGESGREGPVCHSPIVVFAQDELPAYHEYFSKCLNSSLLRKGKSISSLPPRLNYGILVKYGDLLLIFFCAQYM